MMLPMETLLSLKEMTRPAGEADDKDLKNVKAEAELR